MQKPFVDVVVIPISKPMKVGVYIDKKLSEIIEKDGMTSDVLPEIFDDILKRYEVKNIIYAKGPGSFMAIKLSYVFFKTLEITRNIELYGAEGFVFNNNAPIKAAGNSFFVKKDGIISIEKNKKEGFFKLPQKLEMEKYSKEVEPLYILKAV